MNLEDLNPTFSIILEKTEIRGGIIVPVSSESFFIFLSEKEAESVKNSTICNKEFFSKLKEIKNFFATEISKDLYFESEEFHGRVDMLEKLSSKGFVVCIEDEERFEVMNNKFSMDPIIISYI